MELPRKEVYDYGGKLEQLFAFGQQFVNNTGFYYPPHWHSNIELIYMLEGEADFRLSGQRIKLKKGDLFIINPEQVHSVHVPKDISTSYFVIGCVKEIMHISNNPIDDYEYTLPFYSNVSFIDCYFAEEVLASSGISVILNEIYNEYKNISYGRSIALRINITKVVLFVLRVWEKRSVIAIPRLESKEINYFKALFHYLSENFDKDISPYYAAKLCNFSYSYFCKVFKRLTGLTYTEYLNELRIKESEKLLASTDLDVTQIANQVGFCDASYFIRLFKKSRKITPKQFKKTVSSKTF